jgi:beta-galactosidase
MYNPLQLSFRRIFIAIFLLHVSIANDEGARLLAAEASRSITGEEAPPTIHTFAIGDKDFMLDGKPIVIRCGEMHFARVPREYWRHRLQLVKALGMNSVCAYLFWNFHEFEPGKYNWSDQADVAEFCRMAQQEGLWVVLRPGPYVCAEWDGGGLPWWLLKNPKIRLRSQDPDFIAAATAWFKEVGRVLGPLQITKGGPIIMAQVENEYGSYGNDAQYMGKLRQALIDAGFDIQLFACNPPGDLRRGFRKDLFNVVNFGNNPAGAFGRLRELQPAGPLMCGEFYPGWFDTWGSPHHLGNTPQYLADLEYMVKNGASFSLYMAHGGTTFGLWAGADRPFKPDTSSYDYDAPISEAGWIGEKFNRTREVIAKYLPPGESLPEPPAANPVMSIQPFTFTETAAVFDNLPSPIADTSPRNMEAYDQGHGCMIYRTEIPAGPAVNLKVEQVHDFAWIFLDGKQIGVMDRRSRLNSVKLPAREKPARLDILVEAMGHVNFGTEIHDRKGLQAPVRLGNDSGVEAVLEGKWQVYRLPLDAPMLAGLKWKTGAASKGDSPIFADAKIGTVPGKIGTVLAFWRTSFNVTKPADTFLDLRTWGKGVIWINGRCLARFWNIGPTQTAYVPGPWLREGVNEIVILDLLGPTQPVSAGLEKPILDVLRPELDFARKTSAKGQLALDGIKPVFSGTFPPGAETQEIKFPKPVEGKQFCLETINAQDGKSFAAFAELDLLDPAGNSISHLNWTIAYVDSEELAAEDGSASNAINGQTADFWHTQWKDAQPNHPHCLIIDLGANASIGGFRYVPRPGGGNVGGRIKDYRIYVGTTLVKEPVK